MTMKDAVQEVVNEIVKKAGQVSPSDLLERAKPSNSPIHDAFEWNDKKAGARYRLWQARQWLKSVEIVHEDRTERLFHVPAGALQKVTPTESREGTYKPLSILVTDEQQFEAAKREVLADIAALQDSLEAMKAAFPKQRKKASVARPDFKKAEKGLAMIEEAIAV